MSTRTIDGPGGEAVRLPDPIVGLVPANGAVLDLLASFVEPNGVAGLPLDSLKYSNVTGAQRAAWEARPVLADLHLEELLSANIDLVIAHDWQRAELSETIKDSPIHALYLPTVGSIEDLKKSMLWIGSALQMTEKARTLVGELDQRQAALLAAGGPLKGRTAMVYSNYGSGGGTSGSGTSYDVMIELSGLTNAATQAGMVGHHDLDVEGLLTIQPDFLIFSGNQKGESKSLESLKVALDGAPLAAVQNGRILLVDPNQLTTTSQYIVNAAEALQVQALALLND